MIAPHRNRLRWLLAALCLAGAGISGELVREHAGPWPNADRTPGFLGRLCGDGLDGQSECQAVLQSEWSAFDITVPTVSGTLSIARHRVVVPVAFVGLAYFVFLGVWLVFAGRPERWGGWYAVPLAAVVAGGCGSVALLWILFTRLDTRCTWCLVTHATNGVLLLGVLALRPIGRPKWPVRRPDGCDPHPRAGLARGAAFRIVGFASIVIVTLWLYRGAKLETRAEVAKLLPYKAFVDARKDDPAFLIREFLAQPEEALLVRERGHSDTSAAGVPTLTVFTDFQCPQCACFAHQWNAHYGNRWNGPIHVDVRHFPLGTACNVTTPSDVHPQACDAGYAAEAARRQGGEDAFWRMHDLLFASSRHLETHSFEKLAGRIGLDGPAFANEMNAAPTRDAVARDIALARALGVRGTPTLFLNGRRVPAWLVHNPVFWDVISAHLREAEAPGAMAAPVPPARMPAQALVANRTTRTQP
jgi:protein-disulfide isomerase